MSKFAVLSKRKQTETDEIYHISYFGGDTAIVPLENSDGFFKDVSVQFYVGALEELSEKGYVPQCEHDGNLYFIKKSLL